MRHDRTVESIRERQAAFHRDTVDAVREAVETNNVVVVGMAWNPHVAKARKALDQAGIPYVYLEYGNYLVGWRKRLAIKLWSGWPTFPQVFVAGQFIGGNTDVRSFLADGTLQGLLDETHAAK